jgi:transcriptional regulator with XRE-family HTH domain
MPKRKKNLTATDALRQAIAESGLAFIELERRSGVKRQSIMKFAAGEQSLRLDLADRLMAVLGVRVERGPIPTVRKTRKPRPTKRNKA